MTEQSSESWRYKLVKSVLGPPVCIFLGSMANYDPESKSDLVKEMRKDAAEGGKSSSLNKWLILSWNSEDRRWAREQINWGIRQFKERNVQ